MPLSFGDQIELHMLSEQHKTSPFVFLFLPHPGRWPYPGGIESLSSCNLNVLWLEMHHVVPLIRNRDRLVGSRWDRPLPHDVPSLNRAFAGCVPAYTMARYNAISAELGFRRNRSL